MATPGASAAVAASGADVASGAVSPLQAYLARPPQSQQTLFDIQTRLREAKLPQFTWHLILNNHASTRPKVRGGRLCASISACKTFELSGGKSICRLLLPNSYAQGDGIAVSAEAHAANRATADDEVCFAVFAFLCADRVDSVLFRDAHWNVSKEELIADIRRILGATASAAAASGAMVAGELQNVPEANLERSATQDETTEASDTAAFAPAASASAAASGALSVPDSRGQQEIDGAGKHMGYYTNIHRIKHLAEEHPLVAGVEEQNVSCSRACLSDAPAPAADGDDRADLSDFWRKGPGRLWARPS